MPPAKPASTVSWKGGFFRYQEIYPNGLRRWWLCNAGWREPTSSDRLPSIGVSLQPAIPRRVAPQQSPLPLHQSPTIVPQIPVRRGNQNARLNLTAGIQSRSPSSCPSPTGCHLYFARRVTFLSCADGVGAENPHATFCGNRGRATASGDPVGVETELWPTH